MWNLSQNIESTCMKLCDLSHFCQFLASYANLCQFMPNLLFPPPSFQNSKIGNWTKIGINRLPPPCFAIKRNQLETYETLKIFNEKRIIRLVIYCYINSDFLNHYSCNIWICLKFMTLLEVGFHLFHQHTYFQIILNYFNWEELTKTYTLVPKF